MDNVEEVKARLDVEDVVGGYIQLRPAGANFRGLCPFHNEKTPSFMVSPEKGIWHCFGCGEGGDIFTFVEKMEGLDFKSTLEKLAQKAGVTITQSSGKTKDNERKERLYQVLEYATKYFQRGLVKNKSAQNYIIRLRGFNKKTVELFRLGYSPDAQTGLSDVLTQKGYRPEEIVKAGLARQKGSDLRDVFRGRMMVPFIDNNNRVIGFTGRHISDDAFGPKYLNTPSTVLFDKSNFIFGLAQAKEAIRKNNEAVVVEGNLDVLTSAQFGISWVVATSGTALTQQQIKTLSRLTKNIKLAFDQDEAGINATERIIPLAQKAGVTLSIVGFEGAKDADELIHQNPEAWKKAIKNAPYIMDWMLERLTQKFSTSSATGKKQISDHFIAALRRLDDTVERDHYVKKLSKLLDVSVDSVSHKLGEVDTPYLAAKPAKIPARTSRSESQSVEEALLALNLLFPDSRTSLDELSPEHFSTDERAEIFAALQELGEKPVDKTLPESLLAYSNYVKILLLRAEEEYRDWPTLDRRIEAFSLSQRLGVLHTKHLKQKLVQDIQVAEDSGDNKRRDELLKQFRDLN